MEGVHDTSQWTEHFITKPKIEPVMVVKMKPFERILVSSRHEEPDTVPVALDASGLILKRFGRVSECEYYHDMKLQFETFIALQHRFPYIVFTFSKPPEYCDIGWLPSAFGAKIKWMDDAPPFVVEYPIKVPEDVDRLVEGGVPNPREDGVTAEIFRRLEFFYDWFPKDLRDEYGYVDGAIHLPGVVEAAAMTMGYDKLLVWMRLHPDALHKWLRLATDWCLKLCEAMEEVVGSCKILWVGDHSASMVGKELFHEFILPYYNKIFVRYNRALRIWHNEGSVSHMLDEVDKIDAEVWQFGASDDPALCKAKTHFCLMGNIHPPWFAKYTPTQVEEKCKEIIVKAGSGGGLWLSTGGGIAPGTPFRNIDAMVRAAEEYGKYPLKSE